MRGGVQMGSNYKGIVVALSILIGIGCAPWKEEERKRAEAAKQEKRIPKSEMKNLWARAKVGDWILLRTPGEQRHMKVEVVKATDLEVVVDTGEGEGEDRYTAYNLEEEERDLRPYDQTPGFVSVVERLENVGGKEILTKIVTLEGNGNTIVNTYSDEVPLDGMVRSARNDKVMFEVIDFLKN